MMEIGQAMRALKAGERVAREGWNGRDMWLAFSPGHPALPAENFWADGNRQYAEARGGHAKVLPGITMKTASGDILMGWTASHTDLLAEDWFIVNTPVA